MGLALKKQWIPEFITETQNSNLAGHKDKDTQKQKGCGPGRALPLWYSHFSCARCDYSVRLQVDLRTTRCEINKPA